MNLTTITFDADKWQLVPKLPKSEMFNALLSRATDDDETEWSMLQFIDDYQRMLAAAPQPEALSPWLPEDEK